MSRYSTPRRDSSSSQKSQGSPRSHNQRPRLLRSSATTPAVTSFTEASPVSHNSQPREDKAAEMLNRMNYATGSYYEARSQPVNNDRSGSSSVAESYGSENSYFSFPNFDCWESHEEEKTEGERTYS